MDFLRKRVRDAEGLGARDGRASGFVFGPRTAWIDTQHHRLVGWRDETLAPSHYQPDLVVIDHAAKRTLLVDAKFRREPGCLLPASGVKDIQAYMQEYQLRRAAILVPAQPSDRAGEVVEARSFSVRGIPVVPQIGDEAVHALADELELSWNDGVPTTRIHP